MNVVSGGVYYVAVTVFANRTFDANDPYNSRTANSTPTDKSYDLLLWADNGDVNGTVVTATAVTPGQTSSGVIGSDTGTVGDERRAEQRRRLVNFVTAPSDGLLQFRGDQHERLSNVAQSLDARP